MLHHSFIAFYVYYNNEQRFFVITYSKRQLLRRNIYMCSTSTTTRLSSSSLPDCLGDVFILAPSISITDSINLGCPAIHLIDDHGLQCVVGLLSFKPFVKLRVTIVPSVGYTGVAAATGVNMFAILYAPGCLSRATAHT